MYQIQDDPVKKILIGFGESLPAPEVAWSLLDRGYRVAVFARHGAHFSLCKFNEIDIIRINAPEFDAYQTICDIERYINENKIDAIMPLDDASVWICDRVNCNNGMKVLGPRSRQTEFALDKRLQIEAAVNSGLQVPDTKILYCLKDADDLNHFPLILKPAMAIENSNGKLWKGKFYLCADKDDLKSALENWQGEYALLAQPLCQGIGEGIFGIADESGVYAWSAHRRVRMMNPEGSGSSACKNIQLDEKLKQSVENMIKSIGWRGMFMVEFLRENNGKALFMELNGRPWGSMALARRMGFEYPAWAAENVFSSDFCPPEIETEKSILCRHLGREILHVLKVLRGPKSKAIKKWPSRWKTIYDVLIVNSNHCWYNCRKGELKLFLYDTYCTVFSLLFGKGKQ